MLPEAWAEWTKRFWWLRGVASAFAVTAIAVQGLSWDQFKFLRAVHALLAGWNHVAGVVGAYVGQLLRLPDISAAGVNALIITVSVVIPSELAYYHRDQSLSFRLRWLAHFIAFTVLSFTFMVWIFHTNKHMWLALVIILCGGFIQYQAIFRRFPSYGRGFFSVLTFFAALEVLYLLHLPIVRESVDRFSCQMLEIPPEEC